MYANEVSAKVLFLFRWPIQRNLQLGEEILWVSAGVACEQLHDSLVLWALQVPIELLKEEQEYHDLLLKSFCQSSFF